MDFDRLKQIRNRQNAFANMIGLSVTEIGHGTAKTEMPITPDHLNPMGSVHGGCQSTMADVTGGAAAVSHGRQVTTLDGTLHYLRPGLDVTCLYGEARELKYGKRISVYEITISDQNGKVLSEGIYTYMSLEEKFPSVFPEQTQD
jgi:acyl-CoA thioesterase